MHIKIEAYLAKPELTAEYRRTLVSFIKKSLMTYDEQLYKKMYVNSNSIKPFTFAVKLNSPLFEKDKVILADERTELNLSTGDFALGIQMYNAFLKQKSIAFAMPNGNAMTVRRVLINNSAEVEKEKVNIKFLSPLVVRKHNTNNYDKYLTYHDEDFQKELVQIVKYQLEVLCGLKLSENEFFIKPVAPRKTVVCSMGIKFSCSIGSFELSAPKNVINALYHYGMGSRRAECFGMFDLI